MTAEEIGENEYYEVFDGMGTLIVMHKDVHNVTVYMNGQLNMAVIAEAIMDTLEGSDKLDFLASVSEYCREALKGKVFTVEIKKGEEEDG